MFIVKANTALIVNYNRNMFIVQATDMFGRIKLVLFYKFFVSIFIYLRYSKLVRFTEKKSLS
jgi:hypothetical protein